MNIRSTIEGLENIGARYDNIFFLVIYVNIDIGNNIYN